MLSGPNVNASLCSTSTDDCFVPLIRRYLEPKKNSIPLFYIK